MKHLKSLITIAILTLAVAGSALALPPGKGGSQPALKSKAEFEALQPGDQLVLVCKTSDSVQIVNIKDQKHALQLCKEGKMVHCPECKKSYKTTYVGSPNKGQQTVVRRLQIVNEKGQPCMFYARLK
jgi:hypothetical protein